ncbi:MAG: glyoxalase [Xanthomonadaceae bacterium]|nr:glyoxalase [Xanthomonadaceae bacterium]
MSDNFIWYELMTTDVAAARKFYSAVVGWEMSEGGQPGMPYTIVSAGTRGVGGIAALSTEAGDAGTPPAWMGYIGVDDTDATARRVADAGGRVLRAPDDIPQVGRFAVVADPGGAAFMLLAPLPRDDVPQAPEQGTPGTIGWHELYAGNGQQAAFAFYSALFGWTTVDEMDMGAMGKYRTFAIDGTSRGGMMDKPTEMPVASWGYYFNVDGLDAAMTRITVNRGKVLMGPHEVPGGSWIVQATDPQGAHFALVSLRR